MQMMTIIKNLLSFLFNRLFVMAILFLAMFYLLFTRLYQLQIIEGEQLEESFSLSIIKERDLEGQRGNIYDRNGYALAENIIAYNVMLDGSIPVENVNQMIHDLTRIVSESDDTIVNVLPMGLNEDGNIIFTDSVSQILRFKKNVFLNNTAESLSEEEMAMSANEVFIYMRDELFKIPAEDYTIQDTLNILNVRYPLWMNRYTQYQLETVSININEQTLARIEENISKFPGVSIQEDPLRVYNDSTFFAHIIGYTGRIDATTFETLETQGYNSDDIIGKIGIEQSMETYLRGVRGKQTVEVDNLGRTMKIIDEVPATSGSDVHLTLDHDLQIECYNILEQKLAFLLQSTLSMSPKYSGGDKDDEVTLMRDVFSSLFENDIYDIEEIALAQEGTAQSYIDELFETEYKNLVERLTYVISTDAIIPEEDELPYYDYILSKLHEEGYLADDYDQIEMYDQVMNREMPFKELLQIYSNVGMTHFDVVPESPTASQFAQLKDLILNEVLTYHSFKKKLYVDLAQNERFYYGQLCLALAEQGIVAASEEQLSGLKNGRLDTVSFMKEKITNLEITPQELALDPSSGSVVVTDVNTGEVLAMVSYPSYDNNRLVNNFDYDYYMNLLADPTSPLYPMATQGKTAPGSTFKMLTAIAALEEGVVGPHEYFSCLGLYQKIFPPARCWIYARGGTHGPLTVSSALEVSCNYFYYEMGYRLSKNSDGFYDDASGIEKLKKYTQLVGLSGKTGLEIDEADSNQPTQDAVRSSIGQGSNAYTPVQLSRYVSTIANGGTTHELNVVDQVVRSDGTVYFDKIPTVTRTNMINEENLAVVKEGMGLVTTGSRGTARNIFKGFPIKIAGKTGTAQQSMTRPDHGVFVGFAPYDNPEISVVSFVPFGYGSNIPTGMAMEVVGAYYELDEVYHDENYTTDHSLDE